MGRVIVSGGCEMSVPVVGETWVINETPAINGEQSFTGNFSCRLDNVSYSFTSIDLIYNEPKAGTSICYVGLKSPLVGGDYIVYTLGSVMVAFTGWLDQAYRTITLSEPASGNLLTWLQANAVKVG